jgi:hypothetical protein
MKSTTSSTSIHGILLVQLLSPLKPAIDILQLVRKPAPGLDMFDPFCRLGSKSSMLVGELIDNILDLKSEAPNPLDKEAGGLIGVLEPLCPFQCMLSSSYLASRICKILWII